MEKACEDSEVARWDRWGDSKEARLKRCEASEVKSGEKWEVPDFIQE